VLQDSIGITAQVDSIFEVKTVWYCSSGWKYLPGIFFAGVVATILMNSIFYYNIGIIAPNSTGSLNPSPSHSQP
jgi:drug/metabolite transporter (DMT)-like permease